jgi:hypothetical protein
LLLCLLPSDGLCASGYAAATASALCDYRERTLEHLLRIADGSGLQGLGSHRLLLSS